MPRKRLLSLAILCLALLGAAASFAEQPGPERESPRQAPAGATRPTELLADGSLVWIYARPERDPAPLGHLRAGQSVSLRALNENDAARLKVTPRGAGEPVSRQGCAGGWYAVEPAGFVCRDRFVALEPTRYVRAMQSLAPRPGPEPFAYALSMGAPSYRRLPSQSEWTRRERPLGAPGPRPLPPHWRGHEELVHGQHPAPGELPWFLEESGSVARERESRLVRRDVPFGSMLAVTGSFEHEGRLYLMSADGTLVPAERTRALARSEFAGVSLEALRLPLAWVRKRTRHLRLEEGEPRELDRVSERRTVVELRGTARLLGRTRYLETRDGDWLPEAALHVAAPAPRTLQRERWLHFSIGQGTLVAYEGDRPVFATLASPGSGGQPRDGVPSLEGRTTPLGSHRIVYKHRSDDMSPEQGEHRAYFIAEVPFAMYFAHPFAIHVAYWHDSFGEPMSGGCINVSPADGAWLFDFVEPRLPPGWYGVGASPEFGRGTTLHVVR